MTRIHVHDQQVVRSRMEPRFNFGVVLTVTGSEYLFAKVLLTVQFPMDLVAKRVYVPLPAIRIRIIPPVIADAINPFVLIADSQDKFRSGVGRIELSLEYRYWQIGQRVMFL
jgi:hypothetical protein